MRRSMRNWWAGNSREKPKMKTLRYGLVALVVTMAALAAAQPAKKDAASHESARERLIGAWHLVRIDTAGAEGQPAAADEPLGILIYTRDGHMSVQLMYPKSANTPSNEYVHDGYEASFGSYDVDEATHTLTHHVQGSVTRELLAGRDLPRVYRFTREGRLIIRSANPQEHWSVTWEHY